MVCEEIRTKNNIYQHFYVLKTNRNKRHRYGEFLVEGVRNLNEAVNGGWKIKALLIREGKLSDWVRGLVRTTAVKNYRLCEELIRSCEAMLRGPLVLMIGNETNGLCQAFKAHCDELLTIPMNEGSCATSFNVSCAASVMMYEVMRQRREKG